MSTFKNQLLFGGLGFIIALGCCLPFVHWEKNSPDSTEKELVPEPKRAVAAPIKSLGDRLTEHFSEAGSESPLSLFEGLPSPSIEELEGALASLLQHPESKRHSALAILLLKWAESDPAGAIQWCLEHLRDRERGEMIQDIASTWAHRDALALTHWWCEKMPDDDVYRSGTGSALNILAQVDPIAFGTYLEIPRLHTMSLSGRLRPESLPPRDDLACLHEHR